MRFTHRRVIFDARQDVFDIFTVKACLSQECSGSIEQRVRETEAQLLLQNTVVGPINDIPAEIVSPSASTDIEGFTWIGYLGTDKKVRFGLNLNIEFEDIVFELGQDIQNFSVSRDFSRFAFVSEESATIFLYDFRTQALTPVQVEGRSYSTDGAERMYARLDSLSFSAMETRSLLITRSAGPNMPNRKVVTLFGPSEPLISI